MIARFTLQGDARSYAALSMAIGVGAVTGGLFIAGKRQLSPQSLVRAGLLFGLAIVVASVMPTLLLTVVALVFVGICSIAFTSLGNSILQLKSSPQMRGRVMSFWAIAFLGSTTFGGPIVGWFGEYLGPRWSLALGGLAAVFAAALGWQLLRNSPAQGQIFERTPRGVEQVAQEDRLGD